MSKEVRSARGAKVNFDLLRIKQQIASAPKPTNVKAREDFIDLKARRRLKKLKRVVTEQVAGVAVEPSAAEPEVAQQEAVEESKKKPKGNKNA